MNEPTDRDIEAALEWAPSQPRAFIMALAAFRAAAREEGLQEERTRCVSIATKAGYGKYAAEIVDDLWSLIVTKPKTVPK